MTATAAGPTGTQKDREGVGAVKERKHEHTSGA